VSTYLDSNVNYQTDRFRLEKERKPDPEVLKIRIEKKRKRANRQNAADGLGKEDQDMRIPTITNYGTKKVCPLPILQYYP
jgi:hypothetical protein